MLCLTVSLEFRVIAGNIGLRKLILAACTITAYTLFYCDNMNDVLIVAYQIPIQIKLNATCGIFTLSYHSVGRQLMRPSTYDVFITLLIAVAYINVALLQSD